jgi:hypothetical protein
LVTDRSDEGAAQDDKVKLKKNFLQP